MHWSKFSATGGHRERLTESLPRTSLVTPDSKPIRYSKRGDVGDGPEDRGVTLATGKAPSTSSCLRAAA